MYVHDIIIIWMHKINGMFRNTVIYSQTLKTHYINDNTPKYEPIHFRHLCMSIS